MNTELRQSPPHRVRLCAMAALSAVLSAAGSASAHIALDDPPKRDAGMKTRPCGGAGGRSATPAVFAPGDTVTVTWHETVVHPGFFRIALSMDGVTFPPDPPDPPPPAEGAVLAIVPKVSGVRRYEREIVVHGELPAIGIRHITALIEDDDAVVVGRAALTRAEKRDGPVDGFVVAAVGAALRTDEANPGDGEAHDSNPTTHNL